jgi:hypothetical protein
MNAPPAWSTLLAAVLALAACGKDQVDPVAADASDEVPINLPAGGYGPTTGLGSPTNALYFHVTESGRLYVHKMMLYCADSSCHPTLDHVPDVCAEPLAPPRGEATIELRDYGADTTRLVGELTIDETRQALHYVGRSTTYTSTSFETECCSADFDLELRHAGDATGDCP